MAFFQNIIQNGNKIVNISSGGSITISNDKIYINGVEVTDFSNSSEKVINITIDGNVQNLDVSSCQTVTVNGDTHGINTTSGDVTVKNVTGDVKTTSGDVEVDGNVNNVSTTSGNVRCEKVAGNIKTVSGNIKHS